MSDLDLWRDPVTGMHYIMTASGIESVDTADVIAFQHCPLKTLKASAALPIPA